LQQHVTRSLLPDRRRVPQTIGLGLRYADVLENDRGGGGHPTLPRLASAPGCERQELLEIQPVLTHPRLSQTVELFCRVKRR